MAPLACGRGMHRVGGEPLIEEGLQAAARREPSAHQRWPRKASVGIALGAAAVAVIVLAGQQPGVSLKSRTLKTLGLVERFCYGSQLSMNFGSGLTKFDLDDGSADVVRNCPFGASNPTGKIHFSCLSSGMWNLTDQSCYSCPALREKFTYVEGQERAIVLRPAGEGDKYSEQCIFDDGSVYSRGEIAFTCKDRRWQHVSTTCSKTICRAGNVSLNFYGSVGKVRLPVPGSDNFTQLACPKIAPNPQGVVTLKCKPNKDPEGDGTWTFMNQTCQTCNPTTLKLIVEKVHRREVLLPGAITDALVEKSCIFDDGTKIYPRGIVTYMCHKNGWELQNSTCRDWVCPDQTAVMQMEYHTDGGQAMTGQATIKLKASVDGRHEYDCPQGTLKPSGKISFDCLPDSSWRVNTVACGNGEQVATSTENV
mmetsp:Transcript_103947/g.298746  ORF Transcript_103947/g.298746 Transcript_103947/m.298746 type:complete len:423 (+) Transcript_103947:72-1340(+)